MIRISQLCKSYGNHQVLDGLDIELEAGLVYGIVGENGAGKSTFFRCLAGFEDFEGVLETSYEPLKNHLGFLQTNPEFMTRITGWEYLKLLCVARGISIENFDEQNVFELPLEEYAENYSTGMKKKLALMGLLLQRNEVFILDEPFNGVDITSNMLITDIVQQLKDLGKTVIISSHIFSTLQETCDEIYLLKNGQFSRRVGKADFESLNQEMKQEMRADRLSKLKII